MKNATATAHTLPNRFARSLTLPHSSLARAHCRAPSRAVRLVRSLRPVQSGGARCRGGEASGPNRLGRTVRGMTTEEHATMGGVGWGGVWALDEVSKKPRKRAGCAREQAVRRRWGLHCGSAVVISTEPSISSRSKRPGAFEVVYLSASAIEHQPNTPVRSESVFASQNHASLASTFQYHSVQNSTLQYLSAIPVRERRSRWFLR